MVDCIPNFGRNRQNFAVPKFKAMKGMILSYCLFLFSRDPNGMSEERINRQC